MIESSFSLIAAALVIYKILGAIAHIRPDSFDGHPWQYLVFTLHNALFGAGSIALALGLSGGGLLLLAGIALMALADRRRAP